MASFEEALRTFYNGEVPGEAVYSALLEHARDAEERLKWGTLLQLETETKAWLRAPMVAHGVGIEERMQDRHEGLAAAERNRSLPWAEQMRVLHDGIGGHFVPLYQGFAEAAKSRGAPAEEAVCLHMVEHEKAQVEFARRELAGASLDQSLAPIVKFLKYPLTP
jgi:hypothetical protein